MFIISVIITWIALSLLLIWVQPSLYNTDGSLNWWNTLWISAVLIIFVWIICLIIIWIVRAFSNDCNSGCPKKVVVEECDPCEKKRVVVDDCNPCDKKRVVVDECNPCDRNRAVAVNQGNFGNMAVPAPGTFAPVGMW